MEGSVEGEEEEESAGSLRDDLCYREFCHWMDACKWQTKCEKGQKKNPMRMKVSYRLSERVCSCKLGKC